MRSIAKSVCLLANGIALVLLTSCCVTADEGNTASFALFSEGPPQPTAANDISLTNYVGASTTSMPVGELGKVSYVGYTDAASSCGCNDTCVCNTAPPCSECDCNPWYISISGGWQQRETVHEVGDPQTFIAFDSGFALNAAVGARIRSWRLEFETSFMNSGIESAGAAGLSSPSPGNVNLRTYMFNLYRDFEFASTCWKPYVGAGVGTYQSEINGLIPDFFNTIGPPFNETPINATSNMPFAWQLRAGVSRPIGCHTELFSGYRYFRGEDLVFASAPFAGPGAPTFRPDGATVHGIELGLRVNF